MFRPCWGLPHLTPPSLPPALPHPPSLTPRRCHRYELVQVGMAMRQAATNKAVDLLAKLHVEAEARDDLERWRLGAASAKANDLWRKLDSLLPEAYSRIVVAAAALEEQERQRAMVAQRQVWSWERETRVAEEVLVLMKEAFFLNHKCRDYYKRLPELHKVRRACSTTV